MKQIKVYFTDMWGGFNIYDNFVLDMLKQNYEVIVTDNTPDYLFCSVYSDDYLNFTCIRICINGENLFPDFNAYDYVISMQEITIGDRYLQWNGYFLDLDAEKQNAAYCVLNKNINQTLDANKRFCAFVYSNAGADSRREEFFNLLNHYKKIDSGGGFCNNIGYIVKNKIDFLKDYKFSIAFENSSTIGYTTEKIFDAMAGNTIPIYWGDPEVGSCVSKKAIIDCNDFDSFDEVINYIKMIDQDDSLYLKILNEPWVTEEQKKKYLHTKDSLQEFLLHIIEHPYNKAFRRPLGQWGRNLEFQRLLAKVRDRRINKVKKILHKIKPLVYIRRKARKRAEKNI